MAKPFCRSCGVENSVGARFCRGCGALLGQKAPVAADTATLPRVYDPPGAGGGPIRGRRGTAIVVVAAAALVLALGAGGAALVLASGNDSNDRVTGSEPPRERPPTTVTTDPAPPTTVTTLPPQVDSAVALAQRWATALANGDWPTARAIDPGKQSTTDSEMQDFYGGLASSTIVLVTGTPTSPTTTSLRIGYVAHEDIGTGPRTNIYCNTIDVDLANGTIAAGSQRKLTPVAHPGFVSPDQLEPEVLAGC